MGGAKKRKGESDVPVSGDVEVGSTSVDVPALPDSGDTVLYGYRKYGKVLRCSDGRGLYRRHYNAAADNGVCFYPKLILVSLAYAVIDQWYADGKPDDFEMKEFWCEALNLLPEEVDTKEADMVHEYWKNGIIGCTELQRKKIALHKENYRIALKNGKKTRKYAKV